MEKKKNTKYAKSLFVCLLIYMVVYTSYWQTEFSISVWKYVAYLLYAMIGFVFIIGALLKKKSLLQWLYVSYLLIICVIYLKAENLNVSVLILTGLFVATFFSDLEEIIDAYLQALIVGVGFVVLLSFIGVLPRFNPLDGTLLLGFRNINSLGSYISTIIVLSLVKNWDTIKIVNVFEVLIGGFVLATIKDYTAIMIVLVGMSLRFLLKHRASVLVFRLKLIKMCITILPAVLTFVSFWLGQNYLKYSFISQLNSIVTSRPANWYYYLSKYSLNLMGNKVNSFLNYQYSVPFDGAFVSFPINNGLLGFITVMVILTLALMIVQEKNNYSALTMLIPFVLSGFSENQLFIFYQSPAIIMAFFICFAQMKGNNNVKET